MINSRLLPLRACVLGVDPQNSLVVNELSS